MKKMLWLPAILLGGVIGVIAFLFLLPAEWREKLSRLPAVVMSQVMEFLPDE